jgi:hypothetical protein
MYICLRRLKFSQLKFIPLKYSLDSLWKPPENRVTYRGLRSYRKHDLHKSNAFRQHDSINSIFFNFQSLGNHELDDGVDGLVPFLNKINFPVVVSNLDMSKTPTLKAAKSLQVRKVSIKLNEYSP